MLKQFLQTPPLDNYIWYPHGPVIMPRSYLEIADRIRNFKVKEDDIWIVTYPNCGTTWTQEMVWQIVNTVDRQKGQLPLIFRTPFLEFGCISTNMPPFRCPPGMPQHNNSIKFSCTVEYKQVCMCTLGVQSCSVWPKPILLSFNLPELLFENHTSSFTFQNGWVCAFDDESMYCR